MNHLDLYAMLMLGLMGTGHCIGMCGPLVLAFPARTEKFAPHLFYHLGRVTTYIAMGALMGTVGFGLAGISAVLGADFGTWITRIKGGTGIMAAAFLVVFGLVRLGIMTEPAWLSMATPQQIPGYRKIIRSAFLQKGHGQLLVLGLMMGLLPCGLSWAAFVRALPAGGPFRGAVLTAAFAIGTVPGLLLLGTGASGLVRRYRRQSEVLAGLLMFYMAVKLAIKAYGMLLG